MVLTTYENTSSSTLNNDYSFLLGKIVFDHKFINVPTFVAEYYDFYLKN
jgi:hypothetical protein